jgi:hypothetical protein
MYVKTLVYQQHVFSYPFCVAVQFVFETNVKHGYYINYILSLSVIKLTFLFYGKVRLVFGRPQIRISSATASVYTDGDFSWYSSVFPRLYQHLPALFLSRLLPDPSSSVFTTNFTSQHYTVSYIQQNFNSVVKHTDFHSPFCRVSISPHTAQHKQRPVLSKADLPADWYTHTHIHTHQHPGSHSYLKTLFVFLLSPHCEMASTLKHTPPVFNY